MLVRVTSLLDFRLRKSGATLRTQIAPDLPPLVVHAARARADPHQPAVQRAGRGRGRPAAARPGAGARASPDNPRFARRRRRRQRRRRREGRPRTGCSRSFFTTKGEEQGTGLGLAVSREIARSTGGDLELLDDAGTWSEPAGTVFRADASGLAGALTTPRAITAVPAWRSRCWQPRARAPPIRPSRGRGPGDDRHADAGTLAAAARHRHRGHGRPRGRPARRRASVHARCACSPPSGRWRRRARPARPGRFTARYLAPARSLPAGRAAGRRAGQRRAPHPRRRPHRAGRLDGVPVPHQRRHVGHDARRWAAIRPGRRRSPGARRDPDPGAARRPQRHRARGRPRGRRARDRGRPAAGAVSAAWSCWRRPRWTPAASPRSWCWPSSPTARRSPPGQLTLSASAGLLHPLGAGPSGEARFLFEAPRRVGSGALAMTATASGATPARADLAVPLRAGATTRAGDVAQQRSADRAASATRRASRSSRRTRSAIRRRRSASR